jgi:ferric-dicitrate binding protein FerR (iron transport regulator)
MSQYRPTERARQEHEATERQMKRRFWLSLCIPAAACAVVALLVGPDSWLGWAAVVATAPAAAAGVALAFMLQDRAAARR